MRKPPRRPDPRLPARRHHWHRRRGQETPKNRIPLTCGKWRGDSGKCPLYHATLCHLPPKPPKRDKETPACNFVPFRGFRWQPCTMLQTATIFRGGCHQLMEGLPVRLATIFNPLIFQRFTPKNTPISYLKTLTSGRKRGIRISRKTKNDFPRFLFPRMVEGSNPKNRATRATSYGFAALSYGLREFSSDFYLQPQFRRAFLAPFHETTL